MIEKDFDMEAYIAKRVLEIDDLEERKLFKKTIENLFMTLYRWSEAEYRGLEERVFGEFRASQKDYEVYMNITRKEQLDETDDFLHPMIATDLDENKFSTQELLDNLTQGKHLVYTIFIQASYLDIRSLEKEGRMFQGTLRTGKSNLKAVFKLEKNTNYLNRIEELYQVFNVNYLPWVSVCSAYLNKLFNVYLISVEGLSPQDEIEGIEIDFENYRDYVAFNMVPTWNLTRIYEKTSTYPEPCIDKINYEHRIFAHRLDETAQYLVTNTDIEITNIRRIQGDLVITCPIEYPKQWSLYKINRYESKNKYAYPVLSNKSHESFAGSLSDIYRRSVKTKLEIARLITSYEYSHYLSFEDIELIPMNDTPKQTYDMDFFISDELRLGNSVSKMILYFKPKDVNNYLNLDIMSFMVTQIQKLFPEYYCCGELV